MGEVYGEYDEAIDAGKEMIKDQDFWKTREL